MTPLQLEIIEAFRNVTMLPASTEKRFVKNMIYIADQRPDHELTKKQDEYLTRLVQTFRRQIPNALIEKVNGHGR